MHDDGDDPTHDHTPHGPNSAPVLPPPDHDLAPKSPSATAHMVNDP